MSQSQSQVADTSQYNRSADKWYWLGKECKGADAATFKPVNNIWATDSKGLFKQDSRARGADSRTIRVLNLLFAKDDRQVYYIMGVAKDIADVATFEVLDPGQYVRDDGTERRFGFARDSQNVYCCDFFSGKPKVLKAANRETFIRLQFGFAKDDRHVWVESDRIKSADPATFEIINYLYSKDRKNVFYWESALLGADPATFRVVAECTGLDQSSVYFMRDGIAGADARTYTVDPRDSDNGRDALHVYSRGTIVAG
jgi:hypothetical protein